MKFFIAGRHCCVWCDITSEKMQISRDQRPHSQLRTLESLQSDHASFVADGGDLKKAKLHNNVIRPHLFNIPLSQVSKNIKINHEKTLYTHFPLQVCIPSLHVSLGIFYRLFCLFESAVHEVDTLMAYSMLTLHLDTYFLRGLCLKSRSNSSAKSIGYVRKLMTWRTRQIFMRVYRHGQHLMKTLTTTKSRL